MNIIEFEFENWYTFCLRFNWLVLIIATIIIAIVGFIIKRTSSILSYHAVYVDEVSLGIGKNNIKIKYDKKYL